MVHRLLFPLAALFALISVPLWLVLQSRHPAMIGATWHGHEMLFGFALAVIAGFLSTRPMRNVAWVLAGTWFAARIAAATGSGPAAFIVGMMFPVAVFILAAPPLFAGAKRREKCILPAILTALVAADAVWWAGTVWFDQQVQARTLLSAIDLVALLLLLIGGRALRAAASGHLERQGIARRDHLQRGYELPLAVLIGSAVIVDALALDTVAGIFCIGAAILALVRVMPWQLHRTLSLPHLWSLALGYLWLVPGLALKGIAQLAGNIPVTGMLHGIGIGALGTMARCGSGSSTIIRVSASSATTTDINADITKLMGDKRLLHAE